MIFNWLINYFCSFFYLNSKFVYLIVLLLKNISYMSPNIAHFRTLKML